MSVANRVAGHDLIVLVITDEEAQKLVDNIDLRSANVLLSLAELGVTKSVPEIPELTGESPIEEWEKYYKVNTLYLGGRKNTDIAPYVPHHVYCALCGLVRGEHKGGKCKPECVNTFVPLKKGESAKCIT